jgi:methionyl-tRNA synthetase
VSTTAFEQRYESELANEFGNLASRVVAMIHRYRAGVVPECQLDGELAAGIEAAAKQVQDLIDRIELTQALDAVWSQVRRLNRYVEEQAPWQLAKEPEARQQLDCVLGSLIEGLRRISVLLHAYLPSATSKLLAAIGSEDVSIAAVSGDRPACEGKAIATLEPLFPKAT